MSRDGAADVVNCGSNIASPFSPGLPPVDNDTVTADGADELMACEHVDATSTTPLDTRAPVAKIKAPKSITARAFRRGLKVKLSTDEPASFAAELRAKVKRSHGGLAFAGAVGEVTIGQGRLRRGDGHALADAEAIARSWRRPCAASRYGSWSASSRPTLPATKRAPRARCA